MTHDSPDEATGFESDDEALIPLREVLRASGGERAGVTRWRKRPIVLEARQLVDGDGCDWDEIAAWCGGRICNVEIAPGAEPETRIDVPTLEGTHTAFEGDWIVQGTAGEFWRVERDRFGLYYEPAPQFRFAGIDVPAADWTTDPETNRSNSSPEYVRLRTEIARLILAEAHSLVGSGHAAVENVAGLILSQLTHKQNMAPAGSTSALEAAHVRVGALLAELERLRRGCGEHPGVPGYLHPECGFHWHGKDGLDVPVDGNREPRCPRCALAELENAITWGTSCLSCSRVLDSCVAETFRRERAEAALAIAREALHRLSLIDEMAGMGQRDGDPELTARCRRARLALADMDTALEADVQIEGQS